jgi:DNA-binding NarL/FixJ family response regulator
MGNYWWRIGPKAACESAWKHRWRRLNRVSSKKIRVLLADDHTILRRGVRMLLESQPDMEVVGEARNGREALEASRTLAPDVVVMDVSMPEMNGIEGTRQICEEMPAVKVVGLSMHSDAVYVREILRAGARGYLLKDSEDEDLLRAIRSVSRGEAFLSPAVSDAVLADYRKHVANPIDQLTSREREILTLIADGKSNKEIATALNLSVYTVESHRGSVMEKLNLHNTGDIVRFAIRNGLTS